MLVLSRKKNEAIVLQMQNGIEVRVTVADVRGDKVRLAIDAPREVRIMREEVNGLGGPPPGSPIPKEPVPSC